MRASLKMIRAEIERAQAAPTFAPIIKMQAAERAICYAVELLADLVERIDRIERLQEESRNGKS